MTWELDDVHESLRDTCRKFVDSRLRPIATAADSGTVDLSIWREAGDLGLLGLLVPPEAGGSGGDVLAVTIVAEELARASCGLAITPLASSYMAMPHVWAYGTREQQQTWLPRLCAGEAWASIVVSEPETGSDVAAVSTTAVRSADGWVINGSKMFITNAGFASVFVTAARTGESGHRGLSTFIIDASTPGITVGPPLEKLGWHASDTREVHFDDVFVPHDAVLGTENRGFHQIMARFTLERIVLAGMSLGVASECLTLIEERIRSRSTFGVSLVERQTIRHRVAHMRAGIQVARAATYQAAARIQANHREAHRAASVAKYFTAGVAQHIADEAVQIFGGDGFLAGDAARHYRDARVLRIGGGTDEIQLEILSRDLGR
ncbi:acyl-CoA dehydrogenase family protein [Aeromicrobium piscarium]|uniref:Acyl-CoA dehydrogenase n=1 Tax=Aeromicrobium piscarium TaxID=2590901 RepID=A0A554S7U4_9ACTN|nr:acyl-CoA dehydrogenase family protein [Aeromicrobium piscarium]TSD62385.1 acyl-CoA dehydrogenase [Aeromicrobium piscarium]